MQAFSYFSICSTIRAVLNYPIHPFQVQVSIGERMLVGLATGTAMFLTPLPSPPVPTITAGNSWSDERRLLEVQKTLAETVKKNREIYQLKPVLVRAHVLWILL